MPPQGHDLFDEVNRLLERSLATRFEFSLILERSRATIQQARQTASESRRVGGDSRRLRRDSERLRADVATLGHAGKIVDFEQAKAARAAWRALNKASTHEGQRLASSSHGVRGQSSGSPPRPW